MSDRPSQYKQSAQWMVVFGVPFGDGLTAYGPFPNVDTAATWAQAEPHYETWDVVKLWRPEEYPA